MSELWTMDWEDDKYDGNWEKENADETRDKAQDDFDGEDEDDWEEDDDLDEIE
jgi:hypothetical protein